MSISYSRAASLCRLWLLLALAAWAPFSATSLAQQQATRSQDAIEVAPQLPPAPSIDRVLNEGRRLESLGRWADALSHYEDAGREFPDNEVIQRSADRAKLHFSLDRRYADRSYLSALQTLTPQQASGLYLELLRKVNAHYVSTPPWQRLAERGVYAVDIALIDENFRTANGLNLSPTQLSEARSYLYQMQGRRPVSGPDDLASLAAEIAQSVESRCGLRQSATLLEFVTAAAGGLDEYSAYLTSDQLRDVYQQIEGNFVGLGVELKSDEGALLIVHVIPGSPAARGGIVDGDRIVAVDGRSTLDLSTDEAAALLTGAEGSVVRVSVLSPDQPQRDLTVRREHVEVPSLEDVKIVEPQYGVAYIRIPAFQKTTSRDLDAELWKLNDQKMQALILDLRGNPGGLLPAAVEVADKFLERGNIVSTRGRSAQEDFNYQAHYGGTWRVPLVVLIDGDSASASEIFAAAIKDNNRGVVVGEKSYGKGTVQGIFPLGYAGAGVRLTTALFYSPNGQKVSHQGVTPDREVRSAMRPTASGGTQLTIVGNDPILEAGVQAAIEASRQRLAGQ